MDSIYLNGQELPLNSKPRSYAHVEESVGVSPGCFLTATEDCASSPCQNGGICSPSPAGGRLRKVTICKPYTCAFQGKPPRYYVCISGEAPQVLFLFFSLLIQRILSDTAGSVPRMGAELGLVLFWCPGCRYCPPDCRTPAVPSQRPSRRHPSDSEPFFNSIVIDPGEFRIRTTYPFFVLCITFYLMAQRRGPARFLLATIVGNMIF